MNVLGKVGIPFLLLACSPANLLVKPIEPAQREAADSYLLEAIPKLPLCSGSLYARGEDLTTSWFLRHFTPLKDRQEGFEIWASSDSIYLKLDHGKTFQWHKGQMYHVEDGEAESETSDWDRYFVESLAVALRAPLTLASSQSKALISSSSKRKDRFVRIFFSDAPQSDPKADQYVAYFDKDTAQLDGFLYTQRSVSASFTGWVSWRNLQNFAGTIYPSRVLIQDSIQDTRPIHQLTISELRCEPPSRSLQARLPPAPAF